MAINWPAFNSVPPLLYARRAIPTLMAYLILGSEGPSELTKLPSKALPPKTDAKLGFPTAYRDGVWAWAAYFHPDGPRFAAPPDKDGGPSPYATLGADLLDLLGRTHHGTPFGKALLANRLKLLAQYAVDVLKMPPWIKTAVQDWRNGHYTLLNNALPAEADIAGIFNEHAGVMDDELEPKDAIAQEPGKPPKETAPAPLPPVVAPAVPINPSAADAAMAHLAATYPTLASYFIPVAMPNTYSSKLFASMYGYSLVGGMELALSDPAKVGKRVKLLRAFALTKLIDDEGDEVDTEPVVMLVFTSASGKLMDAFDEPHGDEDESFSGLIKEKVLIPPPAIAKPAPPAPPSLPEPTKQLPTPVVVSNLKTMEALGIGPEKYYRSPSLPAPGVVLTTAASNGDIRYAQVVSLVSPWSNGVAMFQLKDVQDWEPWSGDLGSIIGTAAAGVGKLEPKDIPADMLVSPGTSISIGVAAHTIGRGVTFSAAVSQGEGPERAKLPDGTEFGYIAYKGGPKSINSPQLAVVWLRDSAKIKGLVKPQTPPTVMPKPAVPAKPAPLDYKPASGFQEAVIMVSGTAIPYPAGLPHFFPGQTLVHPELGKATLLGYLSVPSAPGVPRMVLKLKGGVRFVIQPEAGLWDIDYQYATETTSFPDGSARAVRLGKNSPLAYGSGGDAVLGPNNVILNPKILPDAVAQPPLPNWPKISCGIAAFMPAGSSFTMAAAAGQEPKTVTFDVPCIVLVHPIGAFGGTVIGFPRGQMDPGDGATECASREFYEETGIHATPVAWLGDYKAWDAIVRIFVGYVIGGTPQAKFPTNPWTGDTVIPETDAVGFYAMRKVSETPWYKQLHSSDREMLDDAAVWLSHNGCPTSATPAPNGLTPAQFQGQPVSWANYEPHAKHDIPADQGKSQHASVIDYQVPPAVLAALKQVKPGTDWFLYPAAPMVGLEYPPPGVTIRIGGLASYGDLRLFAYVHATTPTGQFISAFVRQGFDGDYMLLRFRRLDGTDPVVINPGTIKVVGTDQPQVVSHEGGNIPELLKQFQSAAPYPVSPLMLNQAKVKASAKQDGQSVTRIQASLSHRDGSRVLTAGQSNVQADGSTMVIIGFISFGIGFGPDQPYAFVSFSTGEDAMMVPLSTVPMLGWMTTMSASSAWLSHPKTTYNQLLQRAALFADPVWWLEAHGFPLPMVMELLAQAQPTLPSLAGAPRGLLRIVVRAFSPARVSPQEWKVALAALGSPVLTVSAPTVTTTGTDAVQVTAAAPPAVVPVMPDTYDVLLGKLSALSPETATAVPVAFGGSIPSKVVTAPDGSRYLLKGGDTVDAMGEVSASMVYGELTGDTLPVSLFSHSGMVGSLQPILEDATPLSKAVSTYTPAVIKQVLEHHVIDMFLGNHNATAENWIRSSKGVLRCTDKRGAFSGMVSSFGAIDPISVNSSMWTGGGGLPVGKRILQAWGNKELDIDPAAFAAMHRMLDRIAGLSMETFRDLTGTYVSLKHKSEAEKFYAEVADWQKRYPGVWLKEMRRLAALRGEQFDWPGGDGASSSVQSFDSAVSTKSMGMTKREETILSKDVHLAGHRGKSIRVDKGYVENQEVFVRTVRYNTGEQVVDGTLLSWRLTHGASEIATAALAKYAGEVLAATPQALPFDSHTPSDSMTIIRYYTVIRRCVNHFNNNANPAAKGKWSSGVVNVAFINSVLSTLLPELEDMNAQAQQATGATVGVMVAGTMYNVAPAAIAALVSHYMPTLMAIKSAMSEWQRTTAAGGTWAGSLHEPTPFKWQPPVVESKRPTGFSAVRHNYGYQPNTSVADGTYVMTLFKSPIHQAWGGVQYQISGTGANKATIYFNPANGSNRTNWGLCWASIPEGSSAEAVAKVMSLFERATGIGMKTSSPLDNEILFWSKQAYALTPTIFKPDSVGQGITANPALTLANGLYASGKEEEARDTLVKYVAKQLNMTPAEAREQAAKSEYIQGQYAEVPGGPASGVGYRRFMRMDATRTDLFDMFGQDACLAHNTWNSAPVIMQRILSKGTALVAKANFAMHVAPWTGDTSTVSAGSSSADFACGGATNLFMAMRSAKVARPGHLYFDVSLMLRTDTVIIHPGDDGFGNFMHPRAVSLKSMQGALKGKGDKTDTVSTGESSQVCPRFEVDLVEWLYYVGCADKAEVDQCLNICKLYGVTSFFGGRTPEDVFKVGTTDGINN